VAGLFPTTVIASVGRSLLALPWPIAGPGSPGGRSERDHGGSRIARATTKVGMANLVYNIKRFVFLRKMAVA
jgi:hypothetical protein